MQPNLLGGKEAGQRLGKILGLAQAPRYPGETEAAFRDLKEWTRDGSRVVLVFDGHGSAQRAVERFAGADVAARFVADVTAEPGIVDVTTGCLHTGLLRGRARLAVLPEADLTGQRGSLTKDTSRPAGLLVERKPAERGIGDRYPRRARHPGPRRSRKCSGTRVPITPTPAVRQS